MGVSDSEMSRRKLKTAQIMNIIEKVHGKSEKSIAVGLETFFPILIHDCGV